MIYGMDKPIPKDLFKQLGEKKMTRDEAIETYASAATELTSSSARLIDGLEALGLLKLEEPKSLLDRFVEVYNGNGCNDTTSASIFMTELNNAGLKIVEK